MGKGHEINIWTDPWVPNIPNFKPELEYEVETVPTTVAELINQESHTWNLDLLHTLFNEQTIEAIKRIKLSNFQAEDHMAWIPLSSGVFSTKSAYTTLRGNLDEESHYLNQVDWTKFWNTPLHETHIMVLWRATTESLPSRNNLANRIHIFDPLCPFYQQANETETHLFFLCHIARSIWFINWGFRTEPFAHFNMQDWIHNLLSPTLIFGPSSPNQSKLMLFASSVIITTWKWRNILIFSGAKLDHMSIVNEARQVFDESQKVRCNQSRNKELCHRDQCLDSCWSRATEGGLKINIDVATEQRGSCLAAIARNKFGEVIKTFVVQDSETDPIIAEALAARMTALWAHGKEWSYVSRLISVS